MSIQSLITGPGKAGAWINVRCSVLALKYSKLPLMTQTVRFRFVDSRMTLDVPNVVFDATMEKGEWFRRIVEFPARQRVVTANPIENGVRLQLNTKKGGNIQDRVTKHDRCKQMVTAIEEIAAQTPDKLQDQRLRVEIGTSPISDSDRYGFNATIKRPDTNISVVQSVATKAMRQTATDLRYMPKSILAGSVYALLHENYMSLETNPMGSCSLDSDGMEYEPASPTVNLYAHNIYNHEMQLICLSGLIAIANA